MAMRWQWQGEGVLAFLVQHLGALTQHLPRASVTVVTDEPLEVYDRIHVSDLFSNRMDLLGVSHVMKNFSHSSELRDLIESSSFGGVVSVTHRGRFLMERAFGLANREIQDANRVDTRFATASLSKMFTAVCVARLVDDGRCRFEQPLAEVVPSLRAHFDESVTLASLLSHRSGLGDYIDDEAALPFAGMDTQRLDCPQAFLPQVLRAVRHPAGEFHYSNAGFVLLGLAIEALARMPFPAAIARWVTQPAGMPCTGFPPLNGPSVDLAVGYLPNGQPNFGHLPRVGGADGGIVTNIADLRRFSECLRQGGLISSSAREFLFQESSRINVQATYGHGFQISSIGGESWIGHTGSDPGISARVAFSMAHESSIIVLCNCEGEAFNAFKLVCQWLSTDF